MVKQSKQDGCAFSLPNIKAGGIRSTLTYVASILFLFSFADFPWLKHNGTV